jgi:hypothetical protein
VYQQNPYRYFLTVFFLYTYFINGKSGWVEFILLRRQFPRRFIGFPIHFSIFTILFGTTFIVSFSSDMAQTQLLVVVAMDMT